MPGRDEAEQQANIPDSSRAAALPGPAGTAQAEAVAESDYFGADGLDFSDLLDALNPLQHIPIVGDLYRAVTGDDISAGARLAGSTLFGGPLGFVSAVANMVVAEATGKDLGGNVIAMFEDDTGTEGSVLTAQATPPTPEDVKLAAVNSDPVPPTGFSGARGPVKPLINLTQSATGPQSPYQTPGTVAGAGSRSQSADAGDGVPTLSPAAFQTLLSSVNIGPAQESRLGLTAGAEIPAVSKGTIRDAAMEINRLLSAQANR